MDNSEFVLIIGDFHIPNKAADLPSEFNELLVKGKIGYVLCTGNVGNKETLEKFKGLSDNFVMVRGDCDEMEGIPLTKSVSINGIEIGLIHGHQIIPWGDEESLKSYQRQMAADILVYGHTHQLSIKNLDGKYFVNPGSATGAFSAISMNNNPSFILLRIDAGRKGIFYEYVYDTFEKKNRKIKKTNFEF